MQFIIGIALIIGSIFAIKAIIKALKKVKEKDKARFNSRVSATKKTAESINATAASSTSRDVKRAAEVAIKAANDALKANSAIKVGQKFSQAQSFINTVHRSADQVEMIAEAIGALKRAWDITLFADIAYSERKKYTRPVYLRWHRFLRQGIVKQFVS
jgi:hypothetical protein